MIISGPTLTERNRVTDFLSSLILSRDLPGAVSPDLVERLTSTFPDLEIPENLGLAYWVELAEGTQTVFIYFASNDPTYSDVSLGLVKDRDTGRVTITDRSNGTLVLDPEYRNILESSTMHRLNRETWVALQDGSEAVHNAMYARLDMPRAFRARPRVFESFGRLDSLEKVSGGQIQVAHEFVPATDLVTALGFAMVQGSGGYSLVLDADGLGEQKFTHWTLNGDDPDRVANGEVNYWARHGSVHIIHAGNEAMARDYAKPFLLFS